MTMGSGLGTRIVQLVDLTDVRSNKDGTLTRHNQEVDRGEMCYFASPYDMPAYVRFWRRITKHQPAKKHVIMEDHGVTMELDAYTFGVKVYVKFDRAKEKGGPSKLTVIVEDSDGMDVVASYEI